jgi:hypothetical protein
MHTSVLSSRQLGNVFFQSSYSGTRIFELLGEAYNAKTGVF